MFLGAQKCKRFLIPIYQMSAFGPLPEAKQFPLTVTEFFRLLGYIDRVQPAITTLAQFSLVNHGSLLFEQAPQGSNIREGKVSSSGEMERKISLATTLPCQSSLSEQLDTRSAERNQTWQANQLNIKIWNTNYVPAQFVIQTHRHHFL